MIYGWRSGSRIRLDPQTAGERLEEIRTRGGGALTAEAVVSDARDDASPLHSHFEWNDATAAEAHRLWQARHLIGSITVTVEQSEEPTRGFVMVSLRDEDEESAGQAYVGVGEVMRDPRMRSDLLARAFAELEAFERKYKQLSELAEVFAAAKRARKPLAKAKPRKRGQRERKAARRR